MEDKQLKKFQRKIKAWVSHAQYYAINKVSDDEGNLVSNLEGLMRYWRRAERKLIENNIEKILKGKS